ncbi:putative leucine-rich repeat-containing, plant-type, leucine-rich repeat domain superfamily [Helianthus annuus]|nr:putative leucine-rich repeat-containing, plant-type, leucine-rich repeat domain superfamily [Helianthus annuus]
MKSLKLYGNILYYYCEDLCIYRLFHSMNIYSNKSIQLKRMSNLILLFFFLSLFFISSASSSSINTTHKCSLQQSLSLLQFKKNISSINYTLYECEDWLGSDYNPIMKNWNTSTDCCDWNGVTCDHSTGDVIGLDLSCGMLQGPDN